MDLIEKIAHHRMGVHRRRGGGLCGGTPSARWCAVQQCGDHHEVVGQHRGAHEEFEMLATLDERALHAAPAKQHGDATFDAGAEALPALERPALFERFPFGASLPSRLRDAGEEDTSMLAGLKVRFIEEAAIGAVQLRGRIKEGCVAVERRRDMDLVGGVSTEDSILSNQPPPTLGQEHFMTELHRFEDLASLDQIRVGFENGVELFLGGHLLAVKDATARLRDDSGAKLAVPRDLSAERVDRDLRHEIETTNAHGASDDRPG